MGAEPPQHPVKQQAGDTEQQQDEQGVGSMEQFFSHHFDFDF